MSRPVRICLLGGSGLIGSAVIRASVGREDVRLIAVARSELDLPAGAKMEVLLADPANWGDAIAAAQADTVVSALGTTIKRVGGDKAAFRAVDHDLVLACAAWAVEAGVRQFIAVSSVGANPHARNFYLQVKGETETALSKAKIGRLDLLRPGLLLGARREWRAGEWAGRLLAPLAPLVLHGAMRSLRPIRAETVAEAILALAHQKARGRFMHDYDGMHRAIRRFAFERSIIAAKAVD